MQFTKHCDENKLLPEYQSPYRNNHSCETSLAKLVDDLLQAMEEQLVTDVVILDLSAAFDTVDHYLLLEVIEKIFGVTDKAKQWYYNYIKWRKYSVIIGKNKSEPRQLKCSMPQGSIQAAFLFISYVSMVDEMVKDLKLNRFADDHNVRKTFKPDQIEHHQEINTIAVLEKSMLDIKSGMDAVRLKMNNSRTKFIYFGGPRQLEKCITSQIKHKWRTDTKESNDKISRGLP